MPKLVEVDHDPFAQSDKGDKDGAARFADAASAALGVPRSAVAGHIALETAGGAKTLGAYNYGNIKTGANWKGPAVAVTVPEFTRSGAPVAEPSKFRSYQSPEHAADDYAALIKSRYPGAVGAATPAEFADALKAGGYATDPNYAAKLVAAAGRQAPKLVEVDHDPFATPKEQAPTTPANSRGAGFVDPRMIGSKTEREQATIPARRAAYKAGQEAGPVRGLINVLEGPTLGFSNRLIGVGGGVINALSGGKFGEGYSEARDYAQGASAKAASDNPIFSAVTQAMASAPLMARTIGTGLIKGTGVAANALRAAESGAITGGLSAIGASRADESAQPDGAAQSAGIGGALANHALIGAASGAAIGGALAPVGAALGAVGRNVQQRFSTKAAASAAEQKIAEAILRDAQPRMSGRVVENAAGESVSIPGLSADSVLGQAGRRINKLGPGAMVADAGGENTRKLLDTLAVLPGATKDAVAAATRARRASRGMEMIDAAENALGTGGRRLAGTVDDLIEQRAKAASPLYAQVDKMHVLPSDELQSIIAAADRRGASSIARDIATSDRVPYTLGDAPGKISMRDLDLLKRGLDDMISAQTDLAGKVSDRGRSLMGLKRDLVNELDRLTTDPETGVSIYKMARDAHAGPSALIDAAKAGRKAMSGDAASIDATKRGMSASELDAFKVGEFEALRQKIGASSAGRGELMNMRENIATQEKLRSMFPSQRAYREFAASVAAQDRKRLLDGAGKGSGTAERLYGAGDLDSEVLGGIGKAGGAAASGHIGSAIGAAAQVWNQVKLPESVRDEMGRILLTKGEAGRKAINALSATANSVAERRARNALIIGAFSGRGGAAASAGISD